MKYYRKHCAITKIMFLTLLKDFFHKDKYLNLLGVLSVFIVLSYGLTLKTPVIIDIDSDIVNFFMQSWLI